MTRIKFFFKTLLRHLHLNSWGKDGHLVVLNPQEYISKHLKNTPTVIVYLPPDYYLDWRRYPVLYAHDGQNLFDEKTSFVGEWHLDDNINTLIRQNLLRGLIVVGVYNNGAERANEYTPTLINCKWAQNEGGKLRNHAKFLVDELKPFIDKKFRTLCSREHTGLMGSSLGGLASFYTLGWHPNVFSKVAAISPSFWWNDIKVLSDIQEKNLTFPKDVKIYIDGGWLEGDDESNMVIFMRQVYHKLKEQGLEDFKNIFYHEDPQGGHNEAAWAHRGKMPILYLYGRFCEKIQELSCTIVHRSYVVPIAKLANEMNFTALCAQITTSDDKIAVVDNGKLHIKQPQQKFSIKLFFNGKKSAIG